MTELSYEAYGRQEEMAEQGLIYEKKSGGAVIWRCLSYEETAVIPEQVDGLPVTELAPYCFSAHMEQRPLTDGIRSGKLRVSGLGGQDSPSGIAAPDQRTGPAGAFGSGQDSPPGIAASDQRSGPVGTFGSGQDSPPGIAASDQRSGSAGAFGSGQEHRDIPALCGNRLRELVLPRTLERVGRYCFYNCEQLRELEFYGGTTDWGSGVFTGCHQMRGLRLHLGAGETSMLKEVLDEVPETLRVEYLAEGEKTERAVLVFPGFYEEGVENTPARILETHVHGSGILYRNCFRNRVFDFQQYDRMFPHGRAQESFEVLAELVTSRLWYPCRLSKEARSQYEAFAAEEWERFGEWFAAAKDIRGIRWLAELPGTGGQEFYDRMIALAGRSQFPEAVGYLMERQRRQKQKTEGAGRRRLEL